MRKRGFGRGLPSYCALVVLMKRPATVTSLSKRLCGGSTGGRNGVGLALRELQAAGLAHVVGWKHCRPNGMGPLAAVWAFGQGDDVPRPSGKKLPRPVERIRPEMLAFVEAIRCVLEGPSTVKDMRERSGIGKGPAQTFTKVLREAGLLRIGDWEASGSVRAPAWVWGGGQHAPKPPRKPKAQIDREYEERSRLRKRQIRISHALASNGAAYMEAA
jgi:hypothetical protein